MNPKTVSPKVWAQVAVTLVLGSLVAALGAVTPGMLDALGPWAPVVFAAVTALGAGLSGYVVADPVRDLGAGTLSIHDSIGAAAPKHSASMAPVVTADFPAPPSLGVPPA